MNEGVGEIRIPQDENAPENPSRRQFLKKAALGSAAIGVTTVLGDKVFDILTESEKKPELSPEVQEIADAIKAEHLKGEVKELAERYKSEYFESMEDKRPLKQIMELGEIVDMDKGVQAIYEKHHESFVKTKKGQNDLVTAVRNLSKFNMTKMAKPYNEEGLPKELAYMIAIQESRGRPMTTSKAGAKGITGVMPKTAKGLGFKPEDANDPYKASKITAKYFAAERDERYGNDLDLLLHAYNAGGNMFGYPKVYKKGDRNAESFYEYMTMYMNNIYKKVKKNGYYEHRVDDEDRSLPGISKRFKVPLHKILKASNLKPYKGTVRKGDVLKIPYDDMKLAASVLLRKPLEALRYAPQVKAKYFAMKDLGLDRKIELAMQEGDKSMRG